MGYKFQVGDKVKIKGGITYPDSMDMSLVGRVLTVARIYGDADVSNVEFKEYSYRDYYESIKHTALSIDLELVGRLATHDDGIPMEEFKINPEPIIDSEPAPTPKQRAVTYGLEGEALVAFADTVELLVRTTNAKDKRYKSELKRAVDVMLEVLYYEYNIPWGVIDGVEYYFFREHDNLPMELTVESSSEHFEELEKGNDVASSKYSSRAKRFIHGAREAIRVVRENDLKPNLK